MKHFLEFFGLSDLFITRRKEDKEYFGEVAKTYARIGNSEMVKLFLENYAIAETERQVMLHLRNGGEKPDYTTYREIKKLLDTIDKIEKNIPSKK